MRNVPNLMVVIGGGLLSAALDLLPYYRPELILFSYFAPLPLFLVGLGVGIWPLCGASLLATLCIFLSGGGMAAGEFFLFAAFLPGVLMTRALLSRTTSSGTTSWYPSTLLLRDFTLLSACIAFIFGVYIALMYGNDAQAILQPFFDTLDPQGILREIKPLLVKLFPVLPGLFAFSWGMMTLINGAIAQGLLVKFQHNLRPSPSFTSLSAPTSFMIALGVCLFLSVVGVGYVDSFGKSGAFVFAFPFFLIGLGVIHQWLRRTSHGTLWLTLFYISLGFLCWPVFFVVLLGLAKPWFKNFASP